MPTVPFSQPELYSKGSWNRLGNVRLLSVRVPALRSPLPLAEGERIKVRGNRVGSADRLSRGRLGRLALCKGEGEGEG